MTTIVSPLVNIHTHRLNSDGSIQILSNDLNFSINTPTATYGKEVLFSVGLHPLFLQDDTVFDYGFFRQLNRQFSIAAIGECGLDKNAPVSTEQQITLFKEQAAFASDNHLPVIIHCVGRWNELELLFKERTITDTPWIIHGFRKTQLAEKFLRLGAYFGIGTALLYDERLQNCVRLIPTDRIFLETDDSDANILALYEKLASLKSVPLHTLREELYANYRVTFNHD